MARTALLVLFSVLASCGAVEVRSSGLRKATDTDQQKINPPLKDVKSDKKFFGPPFPADYPDDKRPVPDKDVLDMVKGQNQPYPSLQSREDYDKDFVKDENSDTGAWKAQFEYDHLRRDLQKAMEDAKRAAERAAREGRDADGAQKNDDSAAGAVADAQKELDEAVHGEEEQKTAEDFQGPPSDEKLKELKQAVKASEKRYHKELLDFQECKRQLEEAKKELDDLKAQQTEMEAKLATDTKLWAEQNAVKMNLKKAKQSEAAATHAAKVQQAVDKLTAAEKVKADKEKVLAKEKAEHEDAKKKLEKEKADYENVKKQMDEASKRLQKIHGYKPVQASVNPTKSGAPIASTLSAVALSLAFVLGFI